MESSRRSDFERDLRQFVFPHGAPVGVRLLAKILGEPGLTFVWLMRWQLAAESRGHARLARAMHLLNLRVTGAEVGHGCRIGPGFVAKHPLGMVIGGGTTIGEDCTVLHNVTFGELRPGRDSSAGIYPRVGARVTIGNGATLLGDIAVGDNVMIGAGAVVLRDVRSGATVGGIPAVELTRRAEPRHDGPSKANGGFGQ